MTMQRAQELCRQLGTDYPYLVMTDEMIECYESCAADLMRGDCSDPESAGRMMRQLIGAVKDANRFVDAAARKDG